MAIYLMNKTFIGFQPGSNRINSDVSRFRDLAGKWKSELVPWSFEETELFSLTEINKVKKKGFGKSGEAVVESIYHEPMLYYYYMSIRLRSEMPSFLPKRPDMKLFTVFEQKLFRYLSMKSLWVVSIRREFFTGKQTGWF